MKITETFHIRRYILSHETPDDVLATLNYKWSKASMGMKTAGHPYVDINYHGDSDKSLTMMELRYGEWIVDRQELTYTVEGDDGL